MGSVHGGALSTIIDNSTYLALVGLDSKGRTAAVSINLQTDFMRPIMSTEKVELECKVEKIGKSVAFTSANFYTLEEKRTLLAVGKHTFAFIPEERMKL